MSRFDRVKKKMLSLGREYLDGLKGGGDWPIEEILEVHFWSDRLREAVPAKFTVKWACEILTECPRLLSASSEGAPDCGPGVMGSIRSAVLHAAFKQVRPEIEAYAFELGFLDGDEYDKRKEERDREARLLRGW